MSVAHVGVCVSKHLKEELAWAIGKWLQVISNLNNYTIKKLKKETL